MLLIFKPVYAVYTNLPQILGSITHAQCFSIIINFLKLTKACVFTSPSVWYHWYFLESHF